MSTGIVDLCLIPEVPFNLVGDFGVLTWVKNVISRKGYAVIVIAEGVAESLVKAASAENLLSDEEVNNLNEIDKKVLYLYYRVELMLVVIKK